MKEKPEPVRQFYIHLVSDATGTTLQGLARACLAQFDGIDPVERFWPLVRTERQLERVIEDIHDYPGPVLFTIVDKALRKQLQKACVELHLPCMPVLDPIIKDFGLYRPAEQGHSGAAARTGRGLFPAHGGGRFRALFR